MDLPLAHSCLRSCPATVRRTAGGPPRPQTRRSPMQSGYLIRLLRPQMRKENFCKEVMVAKPMAFIIQRNDKQVASLQGLQQHATFFLVGDGIAQRAIQPVENGGLE